MNEYYYSSSKNEFYPLCLKEQYAASGVWPTDGIRVDDGVFEMFSNPPPGKIRVPGSDGLPSFCDAPPPTRDERIAEAEMNRSKLLAHADTVTADWRTELALGEISDDDRATLSAWMAYKRDVKATKAEDAIVPGFSWPAMPA